MVLNFQIEITYWDDLVIIQVHPSMTFKLFKWFEIWYVLLLCMCKLLVKVQEWIFICFILLKYETKNRFQSLVYNLPFGLMRYIQFLTIGVAMLNNGWFAKTMNCLFRDQTLIPTIIYWQYKIYKILK